MIKLHCDKCGKEIKDKYYTININEYDVNPKYDYGAYDGCAVNAYSNSRDGVLKMLNNTRMYCKDCIDKVEKLIYNI